MGRSLKKPSPKKKGALPIKAYNALLARIGQGSAVCWLENREVHKAVAHLLDEYGVLRAGTRGEYVSKYRAKKAEARQDAYADVKRVVYRRLRDHLKKNRLRRKVDVFKANTAGRSVEDRCLIIFGFTLDELVNHVEQHFRPGMTWELVIQGAIQLDHEVPVRVFNLSTERGVHAAYALENTRPFWRGENARKGVTTDKIWVELFGEGMLYGGIC